MGVLICVNPEGVVIHQVIELGLGYFALLQARLLFFCIFS